MSLRDTRVDDDDDHDDHHHHLQLVSPVSASSDATAIVCATFSEGRSVRRRQASASV